MSDDQTRGSAEPLQGALEMLFSGKRDEEAFRHLLAIAESGNPQGQYIAGMLYALGKGIAKDMVKAAHWLARAAEQGHQDAQFELSLRRLAPSGASSN
ncbi:MAG: hypothetical protein A3J82_08610 [Elusimicrobia bacterium RIFOXYA2_FULL_69_6]|nr:MAG: hypothetical protein A3J82_08610 [Elusimicrobia bacterium RIFOXYA2_FULL_69_6]